MKVKGISNGFKVTVACLVTMYYIAHTFYFGSLMIKDGLDGQVVIIGTMYVLLALIGLTGMVSLIIGKVYGKWLVISFLLIIWWDLILMFIESLGYTTETLKKGSPLVDYASGFAFFFLPVIPILLILFLTKDYFQNVTN